MGVCFETESQMWTEHCQQEKGKLECKNTSIWNILDHFSFPGSNRRKHYSACVNKEKLMTDIQKDKLALIFDRPFLMFVFYVPSNEMMSLWQLEKEETQSKLSKEWKEC